MNNTILEYLGVSEGTSVNFLNHEIMQGNEIRDKKFFIHPDYLQNRRIPMFDSDQARLRVESFFNNILDIVGIDKLSEKQKESQLYELFSHFHEIKELGLGYSAKTSKGHGPEFNALVGFGKAANELMEKWLKTGTISYIEAYKMVELYVENFGPDALSDLTASLILPELVDYTKKVLDYLGVTYEANNPGLGKQYEFWNNDSNSWEHFKTEINVKDLSIILVPYELLVRSPVLVNPRRFVMGFLLPEVMEENPSLKNEIKGLKGGKKAYMTGKSPLSIMNKYIDRSDKALTRYMQDEKVKGKKVGDWVTGPDDF